MSRGGSRGEGRSVFSLDCFSAHHPMIPRRYVPGWQMDMQNRRLILKNCKEGKLDTWTGHISYFYQGRERLGVTRHEMKESVFQYTRNLQPNRSHLSKFNSSLFYAR